MKFVLASGLLLGSTGTQAQVCELSADGSGCGPPVCSDIPEEHCLATVLHVDMSTGAIAHVACGCMDPLFCHIEFGNASPFPVGVCPDGGVCEVVAFDTNNDGIDDQFTAECHPDHVGACCLDIDDGPVPFDTCLELSAEACSVEGGVFHGVNSGCWAQQACCLPNGFCTLLNPHCCTASGGVPLGPNSTCGSDPGQNVCGQACGGIAGILCENDTDYCRLPQGGCCCDFMGMCVPRPSGCPDPVYDPVCGCDGVTYATDCDAAMAGMSVDHPGPCDDVRLCGGLGPYPPCLSGEFCKYPPGMCGGSGDAGGVCTAMPLLCPLYWNPVCGCDGVIYGNECEADAAGVSTTHPGECEPGACCMPDLSTFPPCLLETRVVCADLGGEFQGPGTACPTDPNVPCSPPTGACCLHDANGNVLCIEATQEACLDEGGTYSGHGTSCASDPTQPCGPPISACCFPDGLCAELPTDVCMAEGGVPFPGVPCDLMYCGPPIGACCFQVATDPNAWCDETTAEACITGGGAYQGDGTHCPPAGTVPCGPTGACCIDDPATGTVSCYETTVVLCLLGGGAYQGDGTTCPPLGSDPPCPAPVGACCLPDGTCVEIPPDICVAEGGEPTPGVPCDVVYCGPPTTGACCLGVPGDPSIWCIETTQEACIDGGGQFLGAGTVCPPDGTLPCGPTGACCLTDPLTGTVACYETTVVLCLQGGGAYQGDGTTCPPAGSDPPCPAPVGACCLPDGDCVEIPPDICHVEGGEPFPGLSCNIVDCGGEPVGACCMPDGMCVELTWDACIAQGGDPHPAGAPCSPEICGGPPVACCMPDGMCVESTWDACIAQGGDPHPTDGICSPDICGGPPTGACCHHDPAGNVLCTETTEEACFNEGGMYLGHGTTCPSDPNEPCGPPMGACCFPDGSCAELPMDVCVMEGGEPLPGASCNVVDCAGTPVGACCLWVTGDPYAVCIETTEEACIDKGGSYQGDWISCPADGTVPCEAPTGACCLNDTTGNVFCFEGTEWQCHAEGGTFQGPGSSCPSDPDVPCGSPCAVVCPPEHDCFSGCGVLFQGAECILFAADAGGVFDLSNLGGFSVGARVHVTGCSHPLCDTFCMQGKGCIYSNSIGPCVGHLCGGPNGLQCDDPIMFCEFLPGSCGENGGYGLCTPRPLACQEIYAPVCGCDGITYVNECEAHAAGVSIAYPGECENVCRPADDGRGCNPNAACGLIPEDQCLVTVMGRGPASNALTTIACECMDFNLCHIELVAGGPMAPVGNCPNGGTCEIVGRDKDGDGIDDHWVAECVPAETGMCCSDIGGSPLPVPVCTEVTQDVCEGAGVFGGIGTTCEPVQACCMNIAGASYCTNIHPFCCEAFEGVPQGPNSTCADVIYGDGCLQVCGGIAGIPCDEGFFCDYPVGTCNVADVAGVCRPIPTGCPDVWDPVCGCDGVTYGNACEAHMADAPIDHWGACWGTVCCNPSEALPCFEGLFCCADGHWACGDGGGGTTCEAPGEVCGHRCGGIVGIPCYADDFCKFPEGTCGMNDIFGVCTPFPGGGCPENYDPVCGCDGVTYGNACEADAAGVSVAHHGECEIPCRPTDDGSGCTQVPCSPALEDACMATLMHVGPDGAFKVAACECLDRFGCHLELLNGVPVAIGYCVTEGPCQVVGTDTDGDGVDDHFTAECVLGEFGACCEDITDGPITYESCADTTHTACAYSGGRFHADTSCEQVQACCFGSNVCRDMNPFCCVDSGGVPQGPDTSCTDLVCYQVCGGIAGIPCDDPDEFCKFPVGTCGMNDVFGACTAIPGGGCPENYDPVCGCDGVTYGNACEADAAGVSVAHRGECVTTGCAATRFLSSPDDLSYCPGVAKTVRIVLNPPNGTSAIGLEDSPPAGWVVSNISDGGIFDTVNWKVKWGPLFPPFPAEVTYVATPTDASGVECFAGTISIDGVNETTCGDRCIGACCPHIPADTPQAECTDCPVSGCNTCDNSSCHDGQVSMCELVGYGCAWMGGCNDDLAGMTRAAYLWRNGECYCWDDFQQNWFPTSCTAASVCCETVGPPPPAASDGSTSGSATALVRPVRSEQHSGVAKLRIPVTVEAPADTSAMALECEVPRGWRVSDVSDGGTWDRLHRKVKWGPFMEDLSRTVRFTVRRRVVMPISEVTPLRGEKRPGGMAERELAADVRLKGLSGTVSFDGINQSITIELRPTRD